jgi:hypothetical protein
VQLSHVTPTRRVTASVDVGMSPKRGNATLQQPPGSVLCTILDRDLSNNSCNCTFGF